MKQLLRGREVLAQDVGNLWEKVQSRDPQVNHLTTLPPLEVEGVPFPCLENPVKHMGLEVCFCRFLGPSICGWLVAWSILLKEWGFVQWRVKGSKGKPFTETIWGHSTFYLFSYFTHLTKKQDCWFSTYSILLQTPSWSGFSFSSPSLRLPFWK